MSSSDGGGTKRTRSSSSGGAPAKTHKIPKLTTKSQQTAVPLFEGWGRVSTSGGHDEQFDKLREKDALWLTNNHKFFPVLAWRKVLEKLKTKTDIESCSNASPFFGDLLREKREREVVLPIVFRLMSIRYYVANDKDESYMETKVKSIPWKTRWDLPRQMTGIWKCRLVSKKWNKVIEDLFRNEAAGHYQMEGDLNSTEIEELASEWGTEIFAAESDVDKFLDHFEPTHYDAVRQVSKKCPFLGRAVRIPRETSNDVEKDQAYWSRLTTMLEKFGDQIWYLRCWLEYSDDDDDDLDFYWKLKQILKVMPNLKLLHVDHIACPTEEELQALEEEMEINPFPELTNLEMISVIGIPDVVCNHLVNQNRHISRLRIDRIAFRENLENCPLFTEKLPNLNQLCLERMNTLEIMEAFERYPAILNLKRLKLWRLEYDPCVSLSRMLNAIGSKLNSDTCKELQLHIPRPTSDSEIMYVLQHSLKCRLKLANIQRCTIHSCVRFSLDFLLSSKNSLREMDIQSIGPIPKLRETEEQVIKFVGYEDKMKESNIAKELPALRNLTVNTDGDGRGRHYSIQPNGVVVQVEKIDVRRII